MSKNDEFGPETLVRRYFYDYNHSQLTGDTVENNMLEELTSEFRAPAGEDPVLSLFDTVDKDLIMYSVYGLESIDIAQNRQEEKEYTKSRAKMSRLLF